MRAELQVKTEKLSAAWEENKVRLEEIQRLKLLINRTLEILS